MGERSTSGNGYSALRAPRPPRAPIPLSLHPRWKPQEPDWTERLRDSLREAAQHPKVIDGLYLGGVMMVVGLAAYILAFG